MCGIVGYIGDRQAAPILLEGLEKLEYRGYDSAGIAVVNDNLIKVCKTTGRISNLNKMTDGGKSCTGGVGIGHTRWATHGAPTDVNAHPHTSNDGKFAVVHNGIIENYIALKEELVSHGFKFISQTDTEVVAHLVDMYYEGDFKAAIIKAASRLCGSYAIGVLCSDSPDEVYVFRKSSPLIIGVGEGENYFASDVTALVSHTRDVIYLEDGEFAKITPDSIELFGADGKEIKYEMSHIWWDVESAEKGGYEHFMLKEIMEQPTAVGATISPRINNSEITLDDADLGAQYLSGINKIVITACGSSYYAGCAGKYAIERLCHIPVTVEYASELRYGDIIIDKHTLLIALSQSGETADTIAAMRECKEKGAKTLAIVNVVGSTISKLADHTLYTWAGPEIAVATTKGYTTQLSMLYLFALYAAKTLDRIDTDKYHELLSVLENIPSLIESVIKANPDIDKLAESYNTHSSMFFIGRSTDYAVSLEGALKMKEISYIHAESYPAGELKHGTIALIDEGQPVVALCCNDGVMEKTMSNIGEIKARGARILAVTFDDNKKIESLADDVIYIPHIETVFAPLVEVVPLQLLAYYVAKARGCDIDKPKNLAKSVTVE